MNARINGTFAHVYFINNQSDIVKCELQLLFVTEPAIFFCFRELFGEGILQGGETEIYGAVRDLNNAFLVGFLNILDGLVVDFLCLGFAHASLDVCVIFQNGNLKVGHFDLFKLRQSAFDGFLSAAEYILERLHSQAISAYGKLQILHGGSVFHFGSVVQNFLNLFLQVYGFLQFFRNPFAIYKSLRNSLFEVTSQSGKTYRIGRVEI